MPTFVLDGRAVVHVGGWAKHVALYPVPDDPLLADELKPYRTGRGTLQFRHADDLPADLVRRVVQALAGR